MTNKKDGAAPVQAAAEATKTAAKNVWQQDVKRAKLVSGNAGVV